MTHKNAVVFGGTGFVGKHVVQELAALGVRVKVATRVPESAYFLKIAGDVGQVVPVHCDYSDYDSIAQIIEGADYVVNCIGILFERGGRTFDRIHTVLPELIATACAVAKVERFVHVSALGVDSAISKYAESKLAGEKGVFKAFSAATILRPSVVFGEDDDFFNQFAGLANVLPFLPLIGGGYTKFEPVYVGDVAVSVIKALTVSDAGKASPLGKIYELGGPEVLSFKQVYQKMFEYTGRARPLVALPYCVAKIQAAIFSLMPKPLLTRDQVESLKSDNIVSDGALGLADLGVQATALDVVLPRYLVNYRAGGRFAA